MFILLLLLLTSFTPNKGRIAVTLNQGVSEIYLYGLMEGKVLREGSRDYRIALQEGVKSGSTSYH